MTLNEILFTMVVLVTNIVQSVTGFAGTLLAMPISIKLIGVTDAKSLLNVLAIFVCFWIAFKDYKNIDKTQLKKIVILMTIGIVIGSVVFKLLPMTWLLTGYGLMILLIAFKKLFFPKSVIKLSVTMKNVIIILAGIIHGMFISGGALLVIYAAEVFEEKVQFRATLSALWVILNSMLLFTHIQSGYFNKGNLKLLLISLPLLVLGVLVGNWLHKKINQKIFLKITYILLLISGAMILNN